MATDAATARFVADQMAAAGPVTVRRMFGEYAVYLDGKVVALICDDSLFVKATPGALAMSADPQMAPPYPGAKPHIVADLLLDDPERLAELVRAVAHDLPVPVARKPGKPKAMPR